MGVAADKDVRGNISSDGGTGLIMRVTEDEIKA